MSEDKFIFAFFPYLKTREPISYQGITIRSNDDLTDLPKDAFPHFEKLQAMFYLRDHLKIKHISYAFYAFDDDRNVSKFAETLSEFQTLICYFYSSSHPSSGDPFLHYEHSSLYIFRPEEISESLLRNHPEVVEEMPEIRSLKLNDRNEVNGYEGVLNNKSYFWVTEGSRIFPPTAHLSLNLAQDLSSEFNHLFPLSDSYSSLLNYFAARSEKDSLGERILTALTWHNRSVRIDIDESEALVNLAIAFESLLDLERDKSLTARFKEAIGLLVGDVSRLDSWITQFYEARSSIVHKGRSPKLMFVPVDKPEKDNGKSELEYRTLVSYGRQIFVICVTTILTGAQLAKKLNLSSLLITNRERYERIYSLLREKDKNSTECILTTKQDVLEIEKYRFVPENGLKIDLLIGASKLMIKRYIESNPSIDVELAIQLQALVSTDSSDHYAALSLINKINDSMKHRQDFESDVQSNLHSIVATLLESIWSYSFMYFYYLEDKRAK